MFIAVTGSIMLYLARLMHLNALDAVTKGILIGLFMAVSVGPTLFAVIKYSLSNSHKAGLAFVLGVSLSDIMYVTIANLAAGWLQMLSTYSTYIAYGGSVVLMIVGLAGLIRKPGPQQPAAEVTISGGRYFRIWASGFLINTINPGVIISWLMAVSATVNNSGGYRFLLFGTCLALILSIDFLKVFLAAKIKTFLTPKRVVYVQRFSSIVIFCLGLLLLLETIIYPSTVAGTKNSNIFKQMPVEKSRSF